MLLQAVAKLLGIPLTLMYSVKSAVDLNSVAGYALLLGFIVSAKKNFCKKKKEE